MTQASGIIKEQIRNRFIQPNTNLNKEPSSLSGKPLKNLESILGKPKYEVPARIGMVCMKEDVIEGRLVGRLMNLKEIQGSAEEKVLGVYVLELPNKTIVKENQGKDTNEENKEEL